jgi:predicted lipase
MWCPYPNMTTTHGNVKLIKRSNKNLPEMFKNIGMVCFKKAIAKDPYIDRIKKEIQRSMSNPNVQAVYIVAHSYGGYVASNIALQLKGQPNSHKLVINTYASILLLTKEDMKGIKMKQYMNKNDVALRCVNVDLSGVTWLNTPIQKQNVIDEWKIHIDYPLDSIVDSLIKKLNS